MTKREKEKVEREKLKNLLKDYPKLTEIIDNLIQKQDPKILDAITPVIEKRLNDARNQGVLIGWYSYAIRAYENIKHMDNVEEIKQYFKDEQQKMQKKLELEKAVVNI